MEIQPQLTMLQKTLLNVEGLGRQLNPELDLWKTARPFLEEWLSQQIGYKKHLKDIKNNLPKYLDLLINLPAKLENLKQSIDLKNSIQEFKVRFTDLQEKQTRYKKYLYFIYILIALQSLLIISFFMSR
jgi:ubiquinone biosynthesis protein